MIILANNPGHSNKKTIWWRWPGNTKGHAILLCRDVLYVCLWQNYTLFGVWLQLLARKHINENCLLRDYRLCVMVQTAQVDDLNAHVNIVSKLVACPQHQKELVQCHKLCLLDFWTNKMAFTNNIFKMWHFGGLTKNCSATSHHIIGDFI